MAKDYVLYIHGVNTREEREDPDYADELIALVAHQTRDLDVVPLPLYWGDVNKGEEERLLGCFRKSPLWKDMWFREFRERQLLQFAGDAALYISRYIGSKVIKELYRQALNGIKGNPGLKDMQPGDRLHLVSHSMGTVVLLDGLFAARWDQPDIPAHEEAQLIRSYIFGLEPRSSAGLRLASIHTMGSPLAIFSLMNVVSGRDQEAGIPEMTPAQAGRIATHDITIRLQALLESLGRPIPWFNYVHPGDPVAFPLSPLIEDLVDGEQRYLLLEDVLTNRNGLLGTMLDVTFDFDQRVFALLNGGMAHGSYWHNPDVAERIALTIRAAAQSKQPVV